MLEDIIISKVRVKLLTLFLQNPGKIYHVREITRQIEEEINAVRRELERMENASMVASEWRQNRRYYTFRKDYPLFPELSALVAKSMGLGSGIIKNRAKLGKIKYALMSLAFAKGAPSNTTDVDVLLVGNIVLPELTLLVKEEELRRNQEINYTAMTEEEYIFRKRKRDPFLFSILERPRLMLIGSEEEMLKAI